MKVLPFAVGCSCVVLLVSCRPKGADNAGVDAQEQERQAEEQEARQQRELHEREADLDERERLLSEREQQLAIAPAPAQQQQEGRVMSPPPPVATAQPAVVSTDASYATFYDMLAPYGAWIEMAGYGYVWQPAATVQDPRWRPYTLGHWAFTDLGWTWMSDEPFGWIAYHYGRWMRTRNLNWVWTPGDQWAPGWVSWRYGDNFVGWAPLPPEARFDGATGIQQWADEQYKLGASDYTFVPASAFGDHDMAQDAVAEDQDVAIYDDSNNMTNIYYDSGAYAVVCLGPNYDFMQSKSRRALGPQLKISRGGFKTEGHNGDVIVGNTIRVPAPRIVPSRGTVTPRIIRERVADTRAVSNGGTPAAKGAVIEAPTTYRGPAAGGAPAAGMQIPSKAGTELPKGAVQRAPELQNTRQQQQAQQRQQPQPQQQQEEQHHQQQQAEQARRQEEAARAAEEQHAKEAARTAERAAADEAATKAAREQAAREQAKREEAVRQAAQPAGSPATGQGR